MMAFAQGSFVVTRYGDGIVLSNSYSYSSPIQKLESNQSSSTESIIIEVPNDDDVDMSRSRRSTRKSKGNTKKQNALVVDLCSNQLLIKVQLSYGIAFLSIQDIKSQSLNERNSVEIPGSTGFGSHSIARQDLFLCSPKQLFNDSVINYYIDKIQKRVPRIRVTNTFFYELIRSFSVNKTVSMSEREKKFRRISKSFEFEGHLLIPVNFHTHWSLAIVCNIHLLKERSDEVISLRKRKEVANSIATGESNAKDRSKVPSSARKFKSTTLYEELLQLTDTERELPCVLLLDSAKCHRAQQIFAHLRMYLQLMLFGATSLPNDVTSDSDTPEPDSVVSTILPDLIKKNGKRSLGPETIKSGSKSSSKKKKLKADFSSVPILVDLSIDDSHEIVDIENPKSPQQQSSDHAIEVELFPPSLSPNKYSTSSNESVSIVTPIPQFPDTSHSTNSDTLQLKKAEPSTSCCSDSEFASPLQLGDKGNGNVEATMIESAPQAALSFGFSTTADIVLGSDQNSATETEGSLLGSLAMCNDSVDNVFAKANFEAEVHDEEEVVDQMIPHKTPASKKGRGVRTELLVNPISLPGFSLAVPLQMNGYDCGPFMLEFISKFSESPPKVDAAFLQSKGGDIFKRCWNSNGGTANAIGCRNNILRHLMPFKEFFG